MTLLDSQTAAQDRRNAALLAASPELGASFDSRVLPFTLDLRAPVLTDEQDLLLSALEKRAAAIAIRSCASLARVGDIDHLGGGLELIPALLMTLATVDYEQRHFTIEHGHTSIGYYSALTALGFLDENRVIEAFRRSLDIAGHVSWVPGGTQLSSGRLGVIIPVAAGLALGYKALKGEHSLVVCHTGDAGWISGQALNGFGAATLHHAPMLFVMHRNKIQLSGTTEQVTRRDPRPVIASLGVEILEIPSLHDRKALYRAYVEGNRLAQSGRPALIYPVGETSTPGAPVTLHTFGDRFGITADVRAFAAKNNVLVDKEILIPGSLMSFRDVQSMLECVFLVNGLPGGHSHHDGGMKGRDEAAVLANPMLQLTPQEQNALTAAAARPPRVVKTVARPKPGTPNLVLEAAEVASIALPGTDKPVTPRAGSEAAYYAIAKKYPKQCFFVSCDLDPSTRLGKAAAEVPAGHAIEMSIEEQAASLLTNGLSYTTSEPQLNAFATFAAFFEGIAREGFEFWRYQRNLTGANEGLNVVMHLSHVGACTGRDHFSGWSLDWINLAIAYLPYLRRFYAPADARAAFIAVRDAAAERGGHIVAIPRDNLPVLTKQGSSDPLWNAGDAWTPVTWSRKHAGASSVILAMGAPAFLAVSAAEKATAGGQATDVAIVNGLPLEPGFLESIARQYRTVLTIEDGLIGNDASGLRGLAGLVSSHLAPAGVVVHPFGITDPQIAPSEAFMPVWEHFGMTEAALLGAITGRP